MPPTRWKSAAIQRPEGASAASTGVRSPTSVRSSSVSSTPASRAIASRCRIPFVEPPLPTIPAIAFSRARRSRNRRAVVPSSARRTARLPARVAASSFASRSSAGTRPSPIRAIPRQSIATAIVLAVKCPAHVPAPGHACRSSSSRSARGSKPRSSAPTASQTSWIVTSRPRQRPARIGPPKRTTAGLSTRASAISAAGPVLSQPTTQTSASKSWACTISSIESAITSREISDARIPGVACDWLSETAIVLKWSGTPPAAVTPSPTLAASSRWFRLQGIVPVHVEAIPTIGPSSRAGSIPSARKWARAPARSAPLRSPARARRRSSSCGVDGRSGTGRA